MHSDIERMKSALAHISPVDRNVWLRMGMALKTELSESGFPIWDEWSQGASTYDGHDARYVWKSIKSGEVTAGTLFYTAREAGWRDDSQRRESTPEELGKRAQIDSERRAKEEAEIQRGRADAADKAARVWAIATAAMPDHPYLARKQVQPVPTLREIDANRAAELLGYKPKVGDELLRGRLLVVPVRREGSPGLSTLELIDGHGRKTALAGRGTKSGGFWATYKLPEGGGDGLTLIIGEGVATTLSASSAAGCLGVAALSSCNLEKVATALRGRYPAARLVVIADLVKATGEPDTHAVEAARAAGGLLAVPDFGPERDTAEKDANDLQVRHGASAVRACLNSAAAPVMVEPTAGAGKASQSATDGRSAAWDEPQPILATIPPETYPVDALPHLIRAAVEEVAGFVQAPTPLVVASALGAVSLASQAYADVRRATNLEGPTGLFLLTIADSGERKSTCDRYFVRAIREYEAQQAEAAKPELERYAAELAAWNAEKEAVTAAIKDARKRGKPTVDLKNELETLHHTEPIAPSVPCLLLADETPESLRWKLAKQWPSAGILSAEAGVVFGGHGMGKDSAMRFFATCNVFWDGGELQVGRRTSESFAVRGARLTMSLQVQAATLREFFVRTGALARGTGFLARFLVAWPESTQGRRMFADAPASWPALARFNRRILEILEADAPITEEGGLTPPVLALTPEAKAVWRTFHDAVEGEIGPGRDLRDVNDVAAKAADNASRLAALFQVFESGAGPVSADAMTRATRIMSWHLGETRRFFNELALPIELADANLLDEWLTDYCRRGRCDTVKTSDIGRLGPSRLRPKKVWEAALAVLSTLDRARLERDGRCQHVAVNPALVKP